MISTVNRKLQHTKKKKNTDLFQCFVSNLNIKFSDTEKVSQNCAKISQFENTETNLFRESVKHIGPISWNKHLEKFGAYIES